MKLRFGIFLLAGLLVVGSGTDALAQAASGDGPAPTEAEFWETAERAVRRVYREDVQAIDWSAPARDIETGGYAACGIVSLRRRDDGVRVLSHWQWGDVVILMVTTPANQADDPYADRHDMRWPGMVFPTSDLTQECASLAGNGDATWKGEPFLWREPPSAPVWRELSRITGDHTAPCTPIRAAPGRRYRVRVEAPLDAHLVIAADCAGSGIIRWNEDASAGDPNPALEFEATGEAYAIVRYRDGWAPYTLSVEEAH